MGLTILPPSPEPSETHPQYDDASSDESMPSAPNSEPDEIDSRPKKRVRLSRQKGTQIAIPGEVITGETQWMRGHGTFIPDASGNMIHASLAGPLQKTNRLLTIPPMRARKSGVVLISQFRCSCTFVLPILESPLSCSRTLGDVQA